MNTTNILRKLSTLLSISLVFVLVACGGKKDKDDDDDNGDKAPAGGAMATVDMANGATITGMVKADGAAPANKPIKMEADPVCKTAHPSGAMEDHWMVGAGGEVANTFVYIKDGLGGKTYASPAGAVTLDQHGCAYEPHVFGVMVGQTIQIKNSDATLHNIHAHGEKNDQFNEGQPQGSPVKERKLDKVEVMIPIKCDVHGWMNCYAGVLNHPFFAVTGKDGKYSIAGVPAGEYTVTAWHETMAGNGAGVTVDQKVTVAAKESKTVDFTVKPQ
ncbi:MAG: carboxypeptidase regulatory-like domain-containing protein [bacterium]